MDDEQKRPMVAADLTPEMRQWLEERARAEDRSMSAIIRIALAEYRARVEAA